MKFLDKNKCLAAIFLSFASMIGRASPLENQILDLEAKNAILDSRLKSVEAAVTQEKPSAFNPAITVIGDFQGKYGIQKKHDHHHDHSHHDHAGHDHDHGVASTEKPDHVHEFTNGVSVEHLEVELSGHIDPFAGDARVVLGIEDIGFKKEARLHLEEANFTLKRWPGLGFAPFELKLGLFKTAIGRMNRLHSHNFNQITAPRAMTTFLGPEGYAAPGLSANFSVSTSKESSLKFFLEGIANSRLPMQAENAEKTPSAIAHAWWHAELAPSHYLDIGASALVGKGKETKLGAFLLLAGDFHYTYQPLGYGQNPLFIFGNEFYTANKPVPGSRWPMGNFSWAQFYLFDSTFMGLRYDLAPQSEKTLEKFQHAPGVYLSHYTTEFLRFRLGYEYAMPELNSFAGDHLMTLSVMFVLGNHPVEPYFANR